ncbi:uncharacterized protein LOC107362715 [Tetranychus urticae]|uniref:Uncharacterized protein n=1 Tax=Tetranychus urticae TaxID=32264 RepID=T1KAG1_TETUR|nr:uncharacterized protein LOC107362715 [Tetranychus urticae]
MSSSQSWCAQCKKHTSRIPNCHSLQDRNFREPQSPSPKKASTSGQSSLNSPIKLTKSIDILKPPSGKIDVFSTFSSNESEILQNFNHPKVAVKVRGEEFSLASQLFPMSPCTLMRSKWAEKMGLIAYPIIDVEFSRKNYPLDCNVCVPIKFYYRNKFVFVPVFIDPSLSIDLLLGMDLLSYVEGVSSVTDFYAKNMPLGDKENFGFEIERATRTEIDRFFYSCYNERYDQSKLALYKTASHRDILQKLTYEQQLLAVIERLEELQKKISSSSSTPSSSS